LSRSGETTAQLARPTGANPLLTDARVIEIVKPGGLAIKGLSIDGAPGLSQKLAALANASFEINSLTIQDDLKSDMESLSRELLRRKMDFLSGMTVNIRANQLAHDGTHKVVPGRATGIDHDGTETRRILGSRR
jgi:hypothetical protein